MAIAPGRIPEPKETVVSSFAFTRSTTAIWPDAARVTYARLPSGVSATAGANVAASDPTAMLIVMAPLAVAIAASRLLPVVSVYATYTFAPSGDAARLQAPTVEPSATVLVTAMVEVFTTEIVPLVLPAYSADPS